MKALFYVTILVAFAGCNAAYQFGTVESHTVTVDSKERVTTGSGDSLSHKYMVFTENRTFENTDSLFHLKWNSSDIQGKIKVGETYKIKTYGWRVPFLSWHENIISVEAL